MFSMDFYTLFSTMKPNSTHCPFNFRNQCAVLQKYLRNLSVTFMDQ